MTTSGPAALRGTRRRSLAPRPHGLLGGSENDPRHVEVGALTRQHQERPTASDLDVVSVASDREYVAERHVAAEGRQREHQTGLGS